MFAEKCTTDYEERLHSALTTIGIDERRLGSASALIEKNYKLDPHNLTGSYFDQLEKAIDEFCCADNDLIVAINDVFEQTYQDVFNKEPAGEFPGYLPKRD